MKKLFLRDGKLMYGSSLDDQSAVEVVNPEVFSQEAWLSFNQNEGYLNDLPSGWTVKEGHGCPACGAFVNEHCKGDSRTCLEHPNTKIARLIPT